MSKNKPSQILRAANYSFDHARNRWFCGKKPVEEDEVLTYLIKHAKSRGITEAGTWAENALVDAKTTPEMTTAGFVKAHMVRNRNRRIAGKYLFAEWCRSVGIEITGKLEEFMARQGLLAARFYDAVAAGSECCKKQARIAGARFRSVFVGWELRDEDNIPEEGEVESTTHISQHSEHSDKGWGQYNECVARLLSTGS